MNNSNANIITENEVKPIFVLITVILGTILIGLDRTVVGLALPKIINEFGLTVSLAGWITTSYIISNAIFVPVFGKLGDMYGNRRIYLWSFVGFILISVFAGMSWNFGSLVFFRVLQGFVGAAVYPTAMSLIVKTYHNPKKRASALGIWSASMAASAAIGPLIGGTLIDNFSWRSVFYINLPIGIIGLLMLFMFLEDDRPSGVVKGGFDYIGATILGIFISSIVLVLDRGQEWGWTSQGALILYFTAIVSGFLFHAFEKRVKNPIIDFKFFRDINFNLILLISFLTFGGMMGSMFLLPLFTQLILGFDATQTGYIFIPMAVVMMFAAPLGSKLSHKFDLKVPVILGIILASFSLYLFSITLDPTSTIITLSIPFSVFAFGLGLLMAPLTNGITSLVPKNEVGIASGIYTLARNIAGAFGIAAFGTVLTAVMKNHVYDIASNTVITNPSAPTSMAVPALIMMKAQIESYSNVFLLGGIVMSLGFFAAIFLKVHLGKGKKSETPAVME